MNIRLAHQITISDEMARDFAITDDGNFFRYLSMKTYNWRGLWTIPTYRGKIKRIFAQFR